MARKYINLFDEQGNPVQVPLGADAENVDLDAIAGLNSTNAQAALAELLGKISQGQDAGGGAGFIDNATIGNLNDIDVIDVKLTGPQFTWKEDKKVVENNGTLSEVTAEGYTTNRGGGTIKLFAGDLLVTNADTDGVLISSSGRLCNGRGEFDGEYIVFKSAVDDAVNISYKADVDYDVHVFVLRKGIVNVPITVYAGKLHSSGQAQIGSTSTAYMAGYSTVITDYITITGAAGKYLFVPEGLVDSGYQYTKYRALPQGDEDASDVAYAQQAGFSHDPKLPYLFVPITSNEEIYRFQFKNVLTDPLNKYATTARVYLVTLDWIKRNGYADQWAGKKLAMYGDSYVDGNQVVHLYTWHNVWSLNHFVNYTNLGHNGWGLVNSGNYTLSSLLGNLTTDLLSNGEPLDVDAIGITCGRNDYSNGVSIGTIDDEITGISVDPNTGEVSYTGVATFMGGLNYLCKWLLENYPSKRIFFITPWYFLDDDPVGNAVDEPVKYIDAVLAVAGKWGIPCFDAARQSGISVQSQEFRDIYFYKAANAEHSSDTSHLSIAGHRRMALGPVCKWLENLFSE